MPDLKHAHVPVQRGVASGPVLDATLTRRAELLVCIAELERCLAAPARPDWGNQVATAVDRLSGAFTDHVVGAEGPDGLYAEMLRAAPRLTFRVERLGAEHPFIEAALVGLRRVVHDGLHASRPDPAWVERVREDATMLLGRLVRHRQRGADLLFEAFEQDLGGAG